MKNRGRAIDAARRRLDAAAGALSDLKSQAGEAPRAKPEPAAAQAAESARREALDAARDALRRAASELEAEKTRSRQLLSELERLRQDLADRPTREDLEQARVQAASAAGARAAELSARAAEQEERLVLLKAEHVRLETLRRKAEAAAADAEATRRSVEETLRRELRGANQELDRAAAQSGAREAKTAAEIDDMRRRLEQGLSRLRRKDSRRDVDSAELKAGEANIAAELETARAVIFSLQREVTALRAEQAEHAARVMELETLRKEALVQAEQASAQAQAEHAARVMELEALRKEALVQAEQASAQAQAERAELSRQLDALRIQAAAQSAAPPAPEPLREDAAAVAAAQAQEAIEAAAAPSPSPIDFPAIEPALDPGWNRLLRLLNPPIRAAYAYLRRLSSGPLPAGQRALLRMTGASLSQALDSLSTIELALSDAPASEDAAALLPGLHAVLAAWDAPFRRREAVLARELPLALPPVIHDPEGLRLALHHALRNALEALPKGGTLTVRAGVEASGAVVLEFLDDGPGFPAAWLQRAFEPFAAARQGHAGLGLAALRSAMRRWGGDAVASNRSGGRGARLALTFRQ